MTIRADTHAHHAANGDPLRRWLPRPHLAVDPPGGLALGMVVMALVPRLLAIATGAGTTLPMWAQAAVLVAFGAQLAAETWGGSLTRCIAALVCATIAGADIGTFVEDHDLYMFAARYWIALFWCEAGLAAWLGYCVGREG